MKQVAFICPVYDMRNHFDLAVELYQYRIESEINEDFYFVFSNKEQLLKLTERIYEQVGEAPKSLVLPDKLSHYKSQILILEKGYHLIRHKKYKARQGYVEALNKISTYTSTEKIESLKILQAHWTSDSSITTNNTYLLCRQDRQCANATMCDYGGRSQVYQ